MVRDLNNLHVKREVLSIQKSYTLNVLHDFSRIHNDNWQLIDDAAIIYLTSSIVDISPDEINNVLGTRFIKII